jgi:hypothetical protein
MMRSWDWLRKKIDKIKQSRGSTRASVQCDQGGFTLIVKKGERAEQSLHLEWDRVTRVFAYKRDCLTVDQMCLVIGSDDLEKWIEVTEDDEGYERLIEQLPKRVAGFPTPGEWWQKVALPPFETQWTQLYGRRS